MLLGDSGLDERPTSLRVVLEAAPLVRPRPLPLPPRVRAVLPDDVAESPSALRRSSRTILAALKSGVGVAVTAAFFGLREDLESASALRFAADEEGGT